MSDSDWSDLPVVMGAAAVVVAVLMVVTAVVATRLRRHNVVDVTWGLTFAAVAVTAAGLGDGDLVRRVVFAVITALWGLRLAAHLATRSRGKGEDPRYAQLLSGAPAGGLRRAAHIARKIYLPQGVAVWFVSLPIQVGVVEAGPLGPAAAVGIALWALGVACEAVGDAQLRRFKADPANRGRIMDRGLWSWTRHPNYFGDACVWWGIYLVAADAWQGATTVAAPLVMTYFLVFATGARPLERHMSERPGYAAYRARTSGFIPLPPRRSAAGSRARR